MPSAFAEQGGSKSFVSEWRPVEDSAELKDFGPMPILIGMRELARLSLGALSA